MSHEGRLAIFAVMSAKPADPAPPPAPAAGEDAIDKAANAEKLPKEIGGPKGPEPTRYGDWEYNGRCTDF